MANLHEEFLQFYENLQIPPMKEEKMKDSKYHLRECIRQYFKDNHSKYTPKFYTQGSYEMGTTIRNCKDECDIDDGCYFIPKPKVQAITLKRRIYHAVKSEEGVEAMIKNKCVRIFFEEEGYHIDIPVYRMDNLSEHPELAVGEDDFEISDPREVIEWFKKEKTDKESKKTNQALIRLICYLKAWSSYENTCNYEAKNMMPSGLAMTILAVKYQSLHTLRDDLTLAHTLSKMKKGLEGTFHCVVPDASQDDLLKEYKRNSLKYTAFMLALHKFEKDAWDACDAEESESTKAISLWRKHLGCRFI